MLTANGQVAPTFYNYSENGDIDNPDITIESQDIWMPYHPLDILNPTDDYGV